MCYLPLLIRQLQSSFHPPDIGLTYRGNHFSAYYSTQVTLVGALEAEKSSSDGLGNVNISEELRDVALRGQSRVTPRDVRRSRLSR